MSEEPKKFKEYYDVALAQKMAEEVKAVYAPFDVASFVAQVAAKVETLELKARVALFTEALQAHLPSDYPEAVAILRQTMPPELSDEDGMFSFGFDLMPMAYFVEVHGLDHFDLSMEMMYEITKRHSAEFTIRPYLTKYPERTLAVLAQWVHDPNAHVRRLVSEGTRPRLPWAGRLYQFIEDPAPVLPLLAQLKCDPSAYVRRSVANHLNDIAKDHPDLVVDVLTAWQAEGDKGTAWITRHALRTLVKQGHGGALALLGYGEPQVQVVAFDAAPDTIVMGESVHLDLQLQSEGDAPQKLVIDYVIYFVKGNGQAAAKVFKWRSLTLAAGETLSLQKKHTIKPITTRRYYDGVHEVAVQINGRIWQKSAFTLTGAN